MAAGRTRRISLGRANGRRFGFSAGLGLDADPARRSARPLRRGSEPGRRVRPLGPAVGRRGGQFEPVLEVRGHGRTAFLLVANCDPYTYAGALPLRVAPLARFEGGLDVVGPRRVTPLLLPRFALYLARGRGQERDPDVLYLHDADRIEAVCDTPTPLQVDGEDLGVTEVVFEAERDAAVVLT